jgi:uncharacterized membrane protein
LITSVPQVPRSRGGDQHAGDTATFRAILTPNRSLSPTGFLVLMSAIGIISFAIGIVFMSMGAWPVMGFFGLDVVLIYWAFRANYRAGREFETVEVAPSSLTIMRNHADGRSERFDFQTYWVRIFLDEEPSGHTRLRLRSHGRDFVFAKFLSDDERREFAGVLEGEIGAALRG